MANVLGLPACGITKKRPFTLHAYSMKLLDHRISLKNEAHPYGEVVSDIVQVRALTILFVRSEQELNTGEFEFNGCATFDANPPQNEIPRKVAGLQSGHPRSSTTYSLWPASTDEDSHILAIGTSLDRASDFFIDQDAITDEEYIAMMVNIDEVNDEHDHLELARGLILRAIFNAGTGEQVNYERVGMFELDNVKLSWLERWTWRTLILL